MKSRDLLTVINEALLFLLLHAERRLINNGGVFGGLIRSQLRLSWKEGSTGRRQCLYLVLATEFVFGISDSVCIWYLPQSLYLIFATVFVFGIWWPNYRPIETLTEGSPSATTTFAVCFLHARGKGGDDGGSY